MYLKSIEVQGFKSFANKIVFQFHPGITGIVGPNGSGKSNVGDAVRWVLGEQSAKQLRGASMQDVIFSGTENRKALGFASVAITLDNADKKLPVDYPEVTVTRRVYRSGESEYLINGSACRLKDINELFYDTGIGKEGYSIIGQGQIDKILSGKPEERRELFDEAAGIVKFKRRKAAAVKKLEDEQANLVRVNDILSELTRQLGPLERQAETARQYLKLQEELKRLDVSLFLADMQEAKARLGELEEKLSTAGRDMEETKRAFEEARETYDKLESRIEGITRELDKEREKESASLLESRQMEGQIGILGEQINTARMNEEHLKNRLAAVEKDLKERSVQKEKAGQELSELKKELEGSKKEQEEAQTEADAISAAISHLEQEIESQKNEMIALLNRRASIKGRIQRYDTMMEQTQIRRAELNQKLLKMKSEEGQQQETLAKLEGDYAETGQRVEALSAEAAGYEQETERLRQELYELNRSQETGQTAYHREASRLESLRNITERYDGYGNSIRRVMEQKNKEKGLLGVVADLIQTDKQYETAIETALGGSIQNIVTEDEDTAKRMIAFLKQGRYGRATFLPLTSLTVREGSGVERAQGEPGAIGPASSLVRAGERFSVLVSYLLGRTLVVDNIDHAIAIARKFRYTMRIVTLEGELLSPGGSMTGGAFKNSGNLLGRRREIEELSASVKLLEKDLAEVREQIEQKRRERNEFRDKIVEINGRLQQEYIRQNTLKVEIGQVKARAEEARSGSSGLKREAEDIEEQMRQIRGEINAINAEMEESQNQEKQIEENVERLQGNLNGEKEAADRQSRLTEKLNLKAAGFRQKEEFLSQNLDRISREAEELSREEESLREGLAEGGTEVLKKQEEIRSLRQAMEEQESLRRETAVHMEELKKSKEELSGTHKAFFAKREELSERMSLLDKETFRLNSQKEKAEEEREAKISYMWEEYELTAAAAAQMDTGEKQEAPVLRKGIQDLKNQIRGLGNVNVNAIEDYRELSQRHEFLNGQQTDLLEAQKALEEIIRELDEGMRRQFSEKFAQIQREFDKVFKQLFGGGQGSLELVEDEDILEAGIRIISQPPGKKLQNMMQLSGGEKALTAIALLFAIQNLKPSPFCLLDEIEAALDESNVSRYANYLHKLTKNTQFIIITHRRGTMAVADRLYGITMQEKGVSALVSVNLIENDLEE